MRRKKKVLASCALVHISLHNAMSKQLLTSIAFPLMDIGKESGTLPKIGRDMIDLYDDIFNVLTITQAITLQTV